MTRLPQLIRDALTEAADPERAEPMRAYMKSELPFHGIAAPRLRHLLRPLLNEHRIDSREEWEADVVDLWDTATHREQRYAAEALTGHRHYREWQDPTTVGLYRHLIVTGAWWDHVDNIASHRIGDLLRSHPDEITPVLLGWADDDDMWLRRTAIIAQLGSGAETDIDLLTHALTCNLEGTLHGSEFFIRKAVGWSLRQHARVDPAWVRSFVTAHEDRLSGLSRREALKHLT